MPEIELTQVPEERVMTRVFGGYDRRHGVTPTSSESAVSRLSDCLNTASEEYPCAAVRAKRIYLTENAVNADMTEYRDRRWLPNALKDVVITDGIPAYLLRDGTVMRGVRRWFDNALTSDAGRLLPYGKGLFATGGLLYIPDAEQDGATAAAVTASGVFDVTYVDGSFADITPATTEPNNPSAGDYWYRADADGLYQYDGELWQPVPVYYIKLTPNSSMDEAAKAALATALACLREDDTVDVTEGAEPVSLGTCRVTQIVNTAETMYVVLPAIRQAGTGVTASLRRRAPRLDFAVVHDNRIWGCRYGENADGAFVNEIYACRMGDPLNWFDADGMVSDGFTASVGEPEPWTGAAVLNDNVVFFKERCMMTVYGDTPDSYRVTVDYLPGIERGSERSAVMIGGQLYYKSPHGVMRMAAGCQPVEISDALSCKDVWSDGLGGTDGRKYYLEMYNHAIREPRLYVYDPETGQWHIENAEADTVCMADLNNDLVAFSCNPVTDNPDVDVCDVQVCYLSPSSILPTDKTISRLYLCGLTEPDGEHPDGVVWPSEDAEDDTLYPLLRTEAEYGPEWSWQTRLFGLDAPDYKRVKSVEVRAWLDDDARFDMSVEYDESGVWHTLTATRDFVGSGTRRAEYRLRRCDTYRFRFSGKGQARFYSLTHTYESAGDRAYGTN